MGEVLVVIFDLIAAAAVCAIAYILYRKFVSPSPGKGKIAEIAYEEGFSDAVRYFGLRKLYEEDDLLKQRMSEVFQESGLPHRYSDILDRIGPNAKPGSSGAGRRTEMTGKQREQ